MVEPPKKDERDAPHRLESYRDTVSDEEKKLSYSAFVAKRQMQDMLGGGTSGRIYYDSALDVLEGLCKRNDEEGMITALKIVKGLPEEISSHLFNYIAGFEMNMQLGNVNRQKRFFTDLIGRRNEAATILLSTTLENPSFRGYQCVPLLIGLRRDDFPYESLKPEAIRFHTGIADKIVEKIIASESPETVSAFLSNAALRTELCEVISNEKRKRDSGEMSPLVHALLMLSEYPSEKTKSVIKIAAEAGLFKNGYISPGGCQKNTVLSEESSDIRSFFEEMISPHIDVEPEVIYNRFLITEMTHLFFGAAMSGAEEVDRQFMPALRKRMAAFPDGIDISIAEYICSHLINDNDRLLSAFQGEFLSRSHASQYRKNARI